MVTNPISGVHNRVVLDRIVERGAIFDVRSDEQRFGDGVAVRVSLVCSGPKDAGLSARLPANPNGRLNSDVLKPWTNGMDITHRPSGKWIVDFGFAMDESVAALYEAPFQHVAEHVRPTRQRGRHKRRTCYW